MHGRWKTFVPTKFLYTIFPSSWEAYMCLGLGGRLGHYSHYWTTVMTSAGGGGDSGICTTWLLA